MKISNILVSLLALVFFSASVNAGSADCPWGDKIKPLVLNGKEQTETPNGMVLSGGQILTARCGDEATDPTSYDALASMSLSDPDDNGYFLQLRKNREVAYQATVNLSPAQIHLCALDIRRLCQSSGFAYPVRVEND